MNWNIRETMTEADIEIILQGAKEKYPEARPRIISDNGPQFIAKDFKEFIRIHAERDWKLEAARKQRQIRRQQAA